MGKDAKIEVEYSTSTFVPSYERKSDKEAPYTPPSIGEKFMSHFIVATVWAGVLVTLPLTYFWVFKKEKENEKILVRRLGKLQDSIQIGGRIPVLPLIDDEIHVDISEKSSKMESVNIATIDRCLVDLKGNAVWSITNTIKADTNTADVTKDTDALIGLFIKKQIGKSTIREVATEKPRLEKKILYLLNDELIHIGVQVKSLALEIQASKNQPFIQPVDGENSPPIPGLGGAIERANGSNDMIGNVLSGMIGHPGFSNIIASVVQTVEEIETKRNKEQFSAQVYSNLQEHEMVHESSSLLQTNDTTERVLALLKTKMTTSLHSMLTTNILISEPDKPDGLAILINNKGSSQVNSGCLSTNSDCTIYISNSKLIQILTGKLNYKQAFINGDVHFSGDSIDLPHILTMFG